MKTSDPSGTPSPVWGLVLIAFAVRLLVRLMAGEVDFLRNGYFIFLSMARHLVDGNGLCVGIGMGCAWRMPLYPLLMSMLVAKGIVYPLLPAIQAALGAATVWVAWRMTRDLFGSKAALLTAGMAALNPYAVVHDTSLQETVLFNFLMAAALFQLLRLRSPSAIAVGMARREPPSKTTGVTAGLFLALAMLTTARIAFFLPCAIVWAACVGGSNPRQRLRQASLVAIPIVLLMGAWVLRNWFVVGAPVVTSLSGRNLWVANNEWTFSHFPEGSIDKSQAESLKRLSPQRRAQLLAAKGEVDQDALAASWAREYAKEHPGLLAWRAAQKLWTVVTAKFSPARGRIWGIGYRAVFVVLHALAALALWRLREARDALQARALILLLFASFASTTVLYWSHTSHKSYLDVIIFMCAASIVAPLIPGGQPQRGERAGPWRASTTPPPPTP